MSKKRKINLKPLLPRLVSAFAFSILVSMLIYYIVTDGNEALTELLNTTKENNVALNFILILFPITFILCTMIELGKYVVNTSKSKENNDKIYRKQQTKL